MLSFVKECRRLPPPFPFPIPTLPTPRPSLLCFDFNNRGSDSAAPKGILLCRKADFDSTKPRRGGEGEVAVQEGGEGAEALSGRPESVDS